MFGGGVHYETRDYGEKLTPLQAAFVREYLVDLNKTQALIRAGTKSKNPSVVSTNMFKLPYVQAAIQAEMDKRAKRTEITADKVLCEIARLAFGDIRKLFDKDGNLKQIQDLDDESAAMLSGVEVITTYKKDAEGNPTPEYTKKIKMWDKNSALEKLAKHLRLLSDRVEVTGKDGGPIVHSMASLLDEIDGGTRGLPGPPRVTCRSVPEAE
jgi:phage terminase small subunit